MNAQTKAMIAMLVPLAPTFLTEVDSSAHATQGIPETERAVQTSMNVGHQQTLVMQQNQLAQIQLVASDVLAKQDINKERQTNYVQTWTSARRTTVDAITTASTTTDRSNALATLDPLLQTEDCSAMT